MNNIFISKTKSFYNYITSTHCKDFKDEWEKYYYRNEALFAHDDIFNTKKKQKQSLINLYSVLRNNEFVSVKNYIFKNYPEEEKFENWVKLLENFLNYIYNFTSPLMITPPESESILVSKNENKSTMTINYENFIFYILFEKSKIRKSSSSTLFDTITGLDKENRLSFIKIEITNNSTGIVYKYNYVEDSNLINEDGLDDEICDLQLEFIKQELDRFIYNYIGIVFDKIVNYDLNDIDFNVFNNTYIRNNYKELEEKWLETTNMESD